MFRGRAGHIHRTALPIASAIKGPVPYVCCNTDLATLFPMARHSLAQALKIKNRQVKKVNELKRRIQSQNRHADKVVPAYDIEKLWSQLQRESEKLVLIKSAISAANMKIQPEIYRIAELRGLVAYMQALDKSEGPVSPGRYGQGEPIVIKVEIAEAAAAKHIEKLEKKIDELQDKIDDFNAKARVDLPA